MIQESSRNPRFYDHDELSKMLLDLGYCTNVFEEVTCPKISKGAFNQKHPNGYTSLKEMEK